MTYLVVRELLSSESGTLSGASIPRPQSRQGWARNGRSAHQISESAWRRQLAFTAVAHMSSSANGRALWAGPSESKVPDHKETGSHNPVDDRAEGNIPARHFRIDEAVVQQIPEPVQSKSRKNKIRMAI